MSALLRQAREILEVAVTGGADWDTTAIVNDRMGGLRMLDAAGWSLAGLEAEFGSSAVFRVERRGEVVRVEASDGGERWRVEGSAREPNQAAPRREAAAAAARNRPPTRAARKAYGYCATTLPVAWLA